MIFDNCKPVQCCKPSHGFINIHNDTTFTGKRDQVAINLIEELRSVGLSP